MARIVIACATDASRAQLGRLLASSGYEIFRQCASGGELRRTMNTCEDGVVVMVGALPDCLPDALAGDFGGSFQLLLIARPEALARCESSQVFKLAYPCAGSAILGAIEMLSQLHTMRLPRRSHEEKALVDRAKARLMADRGLSEAEAHRSMQQYAMRHGVKMTDYAKMLLQGGSDHA